MNPDHPYSYIRALYNLVVCIIPAILVVLTSRNQLNFISAIRKTNSHRQIMIGMIVLSVILFAVIILDVVPVIISLMLAIILMMTTPLAVNYFVEYDEIAQTEGLTVWSINKAKELFKGRKLNEEEGEKIKVDWKLIEGDDEYIHFSKNDMVKMKAEVEDLVYVCDSRGYFGGLKSAHAIYGEPHEEDGIVYIKNEQFEQGRFVKNKTLTAEKEM
jgi:SSS family solute:Na+ symporter